MRRLLPDPTRWTVGWLVVGILAPLLTIAWLMSAIDQTVSPDAEPAIHDLTSDVRNFPAMQEVAIKWACVAISETEREQSLAPLQVWLQHPIERYAVMDAMSGNSYALSAARQVSQRYAAPDVKGPPMHLDGP